MTVSLRRSPPILVLVLLLTAAAPASAQNSRNANEQRKAFVTETHVFRRILHNMEFKALDDFNKLKERKPEDCIVILLGDLRPTRALPPDGLQGFLNRGGAVLLASDEPSDAATSQTLLSVTGLCISSEYTFAAAPDNVPCHGNKPERPFPLPVKGAKPDLFQTQPRVATNMPGLLVDAANRPIPVLPDGLSLLAELPPGCQWDRQGNTRNRYVIVAGPKGNEREIPLPFAVGGTVGPDLRPVGPDRKPVGPDLRGRLLFLADPDVFVNGMMIPTDNRNVEFTQEALKWLADRGNGQRRTHVLFVEKGTPRTDFDVLLTVPPSANELRNKLLNELRKLPADEMFRRLNELPLEELAGLYGRMSDEERNALIDHLPLEKIAKMLDELSDEEQAELMEKFPEDRLVAMGEAAVGNFEEDDGFNYLLFVALHRPGETKSETATRLFVILFMLGALVTGLIGGVVVVRRRYRLAAGLPTLNRATGQHMPTVPPPEERQQAMVKADNVYEAARGVARGVFIDAGLPEPSPGVKRSRPRIVVAGGWWRRWRLRRRVEALWRLAYGKRPTRVRMSRWKALLQEAEELRAAMTDGTIRLETT